METIELDLIHCYKEFPTRTTDITGRVKIQLEPNGINSTKPITVCQLLQDISKKYGQNPALAYENSEKEWQTVTYQEYFEKINKIAKIFIKLGFKPRDSVVIIAINCPEWFYAALAAISAGGILTGIYIANSSEAVQYVLEKSDATICIVDNKNEMDKIREIKQNLPKLKTVIQINEPFDDFIGQEDGYYKWCDIEQIETDNDLQIELEDRIKQIVPNECCSIIFTSDTIEQPKGVMLSHDNIIFRVQSVYQTLQYTKMGEEVFISYLPLNHAAVQLLDLFLPILCAGCVYFADRDGMKGSLLKTLTKARPTRFVGLPRVWEKIHEKLIFVEQNTSGYNQFLISFAKKRIYNYHMAVFNGGYGNYLGYAMGKTTANRIKTGLGLDRCRTFLTGGAPTTPETKRYFCSIDILLFEIYGLSEAGPVAMNSKLRNFYAVGSPIDGIQVKIHNPNDKGVGEVLIKGRTIFMGYLNEPQKTAETFQNYDEWYQTGDLGQIDENNDLFLVGRVKELIITVDSISIAFIFVEDSIRIELPSISNVFIVNYKGKYLIALLKIKTKISSETGKPLDELQCESIEWIQSLKLYYTKLTEILEAGPCPIVMKSIKDGIDRYNKKAYSNIYRIKKFALLPHDFSIDTAELGPPLELKQIYNTSYSPANNPGSILALD